MEITKSLLVGDRIDYSVPFCKINKEKRLVHGFATLDNIDQANEKIPFEASMKAFETFRGNIREMHDSKKAAGKMIGFRPESYLDPATGKIYKGVFITVYVSKGAENTWQKVLDGTLTGFSIGGGVTKAADVVADDGSYRVLEEIVLNEISLVDNPCNQFANIFTIEKGYVAPVTTENVFWCRDDNCIQITVSEDTKCFECDNKMLNVGFVESNDDAKLSYAKVLLAQVRNAPGIDDMVEFDEGFGKVTSISTNGLFKMQSADEILEATEIDPIAFIDIYTKNDDTINPVNRRILKNLSLLTKMKEETMADEVTVVDEVVDDAVIEDSAIVEKSAEAEQVESAPIEKVNESDDDLKKSFEDFQANVNNGFASITKAINDALAPIADLIKALDESSKLQAQAQAEAVEAVTKAVEATNEDLGKRIEAVEGSTAIRKSAGLGEVVQQEPVTKQASKWGGRILDTAYYSN